MSIVKCRNGRQIFIYDPARHRKVYAGSVGPCPRDNNPRLCRCEECRRARDIEHAALDRFGKTRREAWTVAAWAQYWLEECHGPGTTRPEVTTLQHNRERVRLFVERHAERSLESITPDVAARLVVEYPQRAKAVRAMFEDARRRGFVDVSPFSGIQMPKSRGRADITPLTEAEVTRLVEIARELRPKWGDFPAMLTVAAWAGLRPGELCGLDWREVDLRSGQLLVQWQRRADGSRHRTKTKTNRVVPLADPARDALAGLDRGLSGVVFRTPTGRAMRVGSIRHYWLPVRDRFTFELPLDHWLPRRLRHDPGDHLDPVELRHAFGSLLADQGLAARDISLVMGNSERVCAEVYIHPHESRVQERVRDALRRATGNVVDADEQRRLREAN